MPSLVLRIPEELAADLEAEARRTNTTKSEVARRRLAAGRDASAPAEGGFALIADLIGTDKGGPRDLSARTKHYLRATGFGREKPRR